MPFTDTRVPLASRPPRALENPDRLRGTARHETPEQVQAWRQWIAEAPTSETVLAGMEMVA